jgi:hypothetical protein
MSAQEQNFAAFASRYLVGGVSSSFRLNPFTGVLLYLKRAEGPYIHDMEQGLYFHTDFTVPAQHMEPVLGEALSLMEKVLRRL